LPLSLPDNLQRNKQLVPFYLLFLPLIMPAMAARQVGKMLHTMNSQKLTPKPLQVPPEHPGYIRRSVIPPDLSVKKAAELLHVGWPALSNLLNGNAGPSREMALRLEKAFGAKSEELLRYRRPTMSFRPADAPGKSPSTLPDSSGLPPPSSRSGPIVTVRLGACCQRCCGA
jgi:hypothetical protein